jgi:hypothetical protein
MPIPATTQRGKQIMSSRWQRESVHARAAALSTLLLSLMVLSHPACAQEAAPAGASLAEETRAAPWQLNVAPYVWGTALDGDVGVGKTSAKVDASFSDILENLNGALMLSMELRKGRFGLLSDTVFAQLEDDGASERGRVKINATMNQVIQNLAGTFRVGTWELANLGAAGPLALTLDPYAGIRYTYLDTELKGKLDLPDLGVDARRTAEGSEHWVDPIIGLRTTWTLGEHWSAVVGGDVGGIDTSDQYSAEAWGLVGYRFGLFGENNANVFGGYRVLHQKYETGSGRSEFDWDITMHGPIAGLKVTF